MKEVGDLDRPVVFAHPTGSSLGIEMAAAVESAATRVGIPFKAPSVKISQGSSPRRF